MSDDALLDLFKKKPELHCGRFLNSQLNRSILPTGKKRSFSLERIRKIAATVFTILSFKAVSVKAENASTKFSMSFDSNFKKNITPVGGKVTITGTVTDASGNPIGNVSVKFDTLQTVLTGKDGKFSFVMDHILPGNHLLYFNMAGFIPAVRSYHIVMGSTEYNLIMDKEGTKNQFHTTGIIELSTFFASDLPEFVFSSGSINITKDHKQKLDILSRQLKDRPMISLDIVGYSNGTAGSKQITLKRAEAIKKYLVDMQGIYEQRLALKIKRSNGADTKTVFFVNRYEY